MEFCLSNHQTTGRRTASSLHGVRVGGPAGRRRALLPWGVDENSIYTSYEQRENIYKMRQTREEEIRSLMNHQLNFRAEEQPRA